MGKQIVPVKSVIYALSPFQQKIMTGLWKDLPTKIHHKVSENWISATLLLGPLVGTYTYVQNYQEKEKLTHSLDKLFKACVDSTEKQDGGGSGPLLGNQNHGENSFDYLRTTFFSKLPDKVRSSLDSESPFEFDHHFSTSTNMLVYMVFCSVLNFEDCSIYLVSPFALKDLGMSRISKI
ncbi:Cytochrome b-c1 complex subunit 8 [Spatholobus suberectus]|nr:Cytochrome b-c1 complex subunit 8 [Spatholobus suberectus]